jgi:hypothetical protein
MQFQVDLDMRLFNWIAGFPLPETCWLIRFINASEFVKNFTIFLANLTAIPVSIPRTGTELLILRAA